jgi:hypothetical protein
MDVATVIIEQLEENGDLRTFRMRAESGEPMTVAFADEYEDDRSGPFHFLDGGHEREYREGFAECKARKLGATRFQRLHDRYAVRTSWVNIPTERNRLSYYCLCLPACAIPLSIDFSDPRSGRQYTKNVVRDDRRGRFVLYLECRSSHGAFDFTLTVDFVIAPDRFPAATYKDETTSEYGVSVDAYEYLLPKAEQVVVQQFFGQGDKYVINGQAGAVGPNAKADGLSFGQPQLRSDAVISLPGLPREKSS